MSVAPIALLPTAGHPRVLIVDDQPEIRHVCQLAGTVAQGSRRGRGRDWSVDALPEEELEAHPYDLILLDVDLPGMNGEEVMQELRRHPPVPYLKVIMLSGRASGDDLSRILLAGDCRPTSLTQAVQSRATPGPSSRGAPSQVRPRPGRSA